MKNLQMQYSERPKSLMALAQIKFGSIKQLADASGVSYFSLRDINSGKYSPSIKVIDKIAEALEIPTVMLFEIIYEKIMIEKKGKVNTTKKAYLEKPETNPVKFEL